MSLQLPSKWRAPYSERTINLSPSSVAKRNQSGLTYFAILLPRPCLCLYTLTIRTKLMTYFHLTSFLDRTPTQTHTDTIKFIMDVLFPESIICSLAGLENLTMLEAEEEFLQGPVIDVSEREQFDRRIKNILKKSGNP